jgi:hypothetical protein
MQLVPLPSPMHDNSLLYPVKRRKQGLYPLCHGLKVMDNVQNINKNYTAYYKFVN